MPISIIIGVAIGYFVMPDNKVYILDYLLTSLIVLYIGAGITIGANRKVFEYIKILGFKVVFISCHFSRKHYRRGYFRINIKITTKYICNIG